jgi:uncharacterized protein YhfF
MIDSVEAYKQRFLAGLPVDSPYRKRTLISEAWGDNPSLANELGTLIAAGIKTATCSAVWEYQADGDPIPKPGILTIVLDGDSNPLCIVETVEVTRRLYNEVDAQFAFDEGEGDRSLRYWREAHRDFFTRTLAAIGREFSEDMPLVCERFRLIYKE